MESLSRSSVIDLLSQLHDIPMSRETALIGRLQHFQRLKFPAGINVGSGKKAAYDAPAIVKLVVAFELMQFGLLPERAAKVVSFRAGQWLSHIAAKAGVSILAVEESWEDDEFLLFDPIGLYSLSDPHDDGSAVLYTSVGLSRHQIASGLDGSDSEMRDNLHGLHRRFAALNITSLLLRTARYLEEQNWATETDFADALIKWGQDNEWSADDD